MEILNLRSSTAHNQYQAPMEAFPARAGQKLKDYGTNPERIEPTFATRYHERSAAGAVVSLASFAIDFEDTVVAGNQHEHQPSTETESERTGQAGFEENSEHSHTVGMKTAPGTELEADEAASGVVYLVSGGTERARTEAAVARSGHEAVAVVVGQMLSGIGAHP